MATMEELENRLQRLQDIKDIERLQKIYGYYSDYFEYDKVVDLFSDNAESVEIADYGVYKGKESIRRFYIDLLQGGEGKRPRFGLLSINMQVQGVITVAPGATTAKGRWYGFMVEAKPTLSLHEGELRQLWGNGIFENEYIKENEKWYIRKIHFFLNFRTPFEDGWLKTPVVGHYGPDPVVKPDAPPTAWHPYPTDYRFQPHYKHPITGK